MTRKCAICGEPIDAMRSTALVCGPTCRQRLHRQQCRAAVLTRSSKNAKLAVQRRKAQKKTP